MACSSGCPTPGKHASFGECMRAKNVSTAPGETTKGTYGYSREKVWDAELKEYGEARLQGIQPASTNLGDIRAAVAMSNSTDSAYDAGAS